MTTGKAKKQQEKYQPWHLEFRPQKLEDLSGHQLLKRTLINSINQGKIANGYLFCGGKGTGKTSTARIFAKSLNCLAHQEATINPCGKCSNCKEIEQASNLDVIEIDAASNNGVEHIRSVIETTQLAPVNSRYRVIVLDEVHMLTRAAANSLLKTLEEPSNKRVVFILATTEKDKVMDTIASRCQSFDFLPIPQSAVIDRLEFICNRENVKASPEAIKAIAKHSKGGMRDAIQLLEKLVMYGQTPIETHLVREVTGEIPCEELMKIVNSIFSGEMKAIDTLLRTSSELINQGKEPRKILKEILEIYRDLTQIVVIVETGEAIKNEEFSLLSDLDINYLLKIASSTSWRQINLGLDAIEKAEREINVSNSGAWLDVFLLRLAKLGMF